MHVHTLALMCREISDQLADAKCQIEVATRSKIKEEKENAISSAYHHIYRAEEWAKALYRDYKGAK